MWNIISNVSSIVTCVAFLLYLAGHIWVVIKNRYNIYEKFSVVPLDSKTDIENGDHVLLIDNNGCEFSLSSNYGINEIKIYKVDYSIQENGELKSDSKVLVNGYKKLNTDKLYIRCDLGEHIPTTRLKITRSDYTIITFDIFESGKNGNIITCNYKFKVTFKGFLYHLCV